MTSLDSPKLRCGSSEITKGKLVVNFGAAEYTSYYLQVSLILHPHSQYYRQDLCATNWWQTDAANSTSRYASKLSGTMAQDQ